MTAEAITTKLATDLQVPNPAGSQAVPAEQKDKVIQRYKCHTCFTILEESDLTENKRCPECGQPICPECGCHDVITVSRVTGYLSTVENWNNGKKQEFKDRHRYDPV